MCAELARKKGSQNLNYIIEASSDLKHWDEITQICRIVSVDDDWEIVCFEDEATPETQKFRVLRIRIVAVE